MYNFKRLINKYSKYNPITYFKKGETTIDMSMGGIEKVEYEPIEIKGAVIPKTENVMYDNGGFGIEYVTFLYTYNTIEDKGIVKVRDKYFTASLDIDVSEFDKGLHIYRLESGTDEEYI